MKFNPTCSPFPFLSFRFLLRYVYKREEKVMKTFSNQNIFLPSYPSHSINLSIEKCSIRNNYNFNCAWSYFFSNFQKCNFSETLSFGGKSDLLNHYLPFHPSFHLLETLQIIFLSSFTRDKFFELIQILILFMYPRIGWDSKEMKGKRD